MKHTTLNLLLGAALTGIASPALAGSSALVSMNPGASFISGLGHDTTVQLNVSGLTSQVGGFALDFVYDPSIVSVQSVTFGNSLNSLPNQPLGEFTLSGTGRQGIFEVSLEDASWLASQFDNFTLANVTLESLQFGTSGLSLENASLSDAAGDSLPVSTSGGSISVPEGSTALWGPVWLGAFTVFSGFALRRQRNYATN